MTPDSLRTESKQSYKNCSLTASIDAPGSREMRWLIQRAPAQPDSAIVVTALPAVPYDVTDRSDERFPATLVLTNP